HRGLHGAGEPCRRPRLWLARPAPARRRGAAVSELALDPPRAAARRLGAGLPPATLVALGWIGLMIVTALGADLLAPYAYSAVDLKARLAPPALFGGSIAHPLGTDELGRDVLSRLVMSIRLSLLIALFGTLIAATLGTLLGFLAAHFRGKVEALVLM